MYGTEHVARCFCCSRRCCCFCCCCCCLCSTHVQLLRLTTNERGGRGSGLQYGSDLIIAAAETKLLLPAPTRRRRRRIGRVGGRERDALKRGSCCRRRRCRREGVGAGRQMRCRAGRQHCQLRPRITGGRSARRSRRRGSCGRRGITRTRSGSVGLTRSRRHIKRRQLNEMNLPQSASF